MSTVKFNGARYTVTDAFGTAKTAQRVNDFDSIITSAELAKVQAMQVGDGSQYYHLEFARGFGTGSIRFIRTA